MPDLSEASIVELMVEAIKLKASGVEIQFKPNMVYWNATENRIEFAEVQDPSNFNPK